MSANLAEAPNSYRAIARPELFTSLAFRLPWGPSLNNVYANKKNGGGRFKVKRARIFEQAAWVALHEQNVPKWGISHPCAITLIQRANSARGDIDNGIKVVLDTLKKFGVIHDDNRGIVRELHVIDGVRCAEGEEPHVLVRIEPVFL